MAPNPPTTVLTSVSFTTVAPMTTIWTPPASCQTPTPVLFAGTCVSNGQSCYPYSQQSDIIKEWSPWINYAYWTYGFQQVGMSCAPPSSQNVVEFFYSPARGCPVGYITASSSKYYNGDLWAVCCPRDYSSLYSFSRGDYYCYRAMKQPGETMSAIAAGVITVNNAYGTSIAHFVTVSHISMTVIQSIPSTTSLYVSAPAVPMVIPSSWVTTGTYSTPTTGLYGSATSSANHSGPNFHLWHLSFTLSLVVLIAIGVGGCCMLCAAFSILRRCRRRKYRPATQSPLRQPRVPMSDLPTYGYYEGRFSGRAIPTPVTPVTPAVNRSTSRQVVEPARPLPNIPPLPKPSPPVVKCAHKDSNSCSSPSSSCCMCDDMRTRKMSLDDRLAQYCQRCSNLWRSQPVSSLPPSWKPFPPELCSHQKAGHCRRLADKCCYCSDTRKAKTGYCDACNRLWNQNQRSNLDSSWSPLTPNCRHRSNVTCNKPRQSDCCYCRDKRKQELSLTNRLRPYCQACRRYWSSMAVENLPPEWQLSKSSISLFYNPKKAKRVKSEAPKSHEKMFDLGPRHARPGFCPRRQIRDWVLTPVDTSIPLLCPDNMSCIQFMRSLDWKCDLVLKAKRVEPDWSSVPKPDYSQIFDRGPLYPARNSPVAPGSAALPLSKRVESFHEFSSGKASTTGKRRSGHPKAQYPSDIPNGGLHDDGPTHRTPSFQVPSEPSTVSKANGAPKKGAVKRKSATRRENADGQAHTTDNGGKHKSLQYGKPKYQSDVPGMFD